MKRGVAVLLTALFQFNVTWAEEPVHFADPNLETAVENVLWLDDPTPTDMLGLTSLDIGDCGITDLSPLSGLTNLEKLDLNRNHIRDISPPSRN